MSKNRFELPFVMTNREMPTPGPGGDEGQGSGQGTIDPYPCNWDNWLVLFKADLDNDGDFDLDDYLAWWHANDFDYNQWIAAGNDPSHWQP